MTTQRNEGAASPEQVHQWIEQAKAIAGDLLTETMRRIPSPDPEDPELFDLRQLEMVLAYFVACQMHTSSRLYGEPLSSVKKRLQLAVDIALADLAPGVEAAALAASPAAGRA